MNMDCQNAKLFLRKPLVCPMEFFSIVSSRNTPAFVHLCRRRLAFIFPPARLAAKIQPIQPLRCCNNYCLIELQ